MNYEGISPLKDEEFQIIKTLIYTKAGISLHEGKRELVIARLSKLIRKYNLSTFGDYLNILQRDNNGTYTAEFIDAISTNQTYFFRENAHFDYMTDVILPEIKQKNVSPLHLRLWSCASSTGEEAISLAITVMEYCEQQHLNLTFEILASDISTKVLNQARTGIYPETRTKDIPRPILKKYFQYGTGEWEGYIKVKKLVSDHIAFKRINLLESFDEGIFDIVFCRNVMIYFDLDTHQYLIEKLYRFVKEGGYLFTGHSESLFNIKHHFISIKPSIYKKKK